MASDEGSRAARPLSLIDALLTRVGSIRSPSVVSLSGSARDPTLASAAPSRWRKAGNWRER